MYISEFANIRYDHTEKSNILNLLNYASEWLYSPVDEELENKLYFLDMDLKEDDREKKISIKNKSSSKDSYFRVEDYFKDELQKKLNEDINNNNNYTNLASIKKYGLFINDKI